MQTPAVRRPLAPAPLALALTLTLACSGGGPGALEGPVPEGRAPAVVSNRLCDAYRRCDCGEAAGGVSLEGCELGFRYGWQGLLEDNLEAGLTYDGDCLARRLTAMAERGCDTTLATGAGCGPETCLIFHGDLPEGAECDGGPSASDCRQGLVCLGTCQVPCTGPAAGLLDVGGRCMEGGAFVGTCDPALVCDPATELCAAPPPAGSPCVQGRCAAGAWCDPTSGEQVCAALRPEGEDCMFRPQSCESQLCADGACDPFPGEGEACGGVCAGDLVCARGADGALACASPPRVGEACLADFLHRCEEGLACVDEVCVEPPGNGEACLEPAAGSTVQCRGDLICGSRVCRITPRAPGCERCEDPDGNCVVRVCMPRPAAVCSDSGGLLY